MQISIKPLDPVLFRGGRPFNIDLDMWASSMFPPYPSVIYGALRAIYFVKNPNELRYANDPDNDKTLLLKIQTIAYSKDGRVLFPMPNDYVKKKDSEERIAFGLMPKELKNVISSCPTNYVLAPQKGTRVEGVSGAFISKENFEKILQGNNQVEYIDRSDLICEEPKIGIGIDHTTGTTKDKLIYQVIMHRFLDTSILVQYEGLDLPESGFMQLGGERRVAIFERSNGDIKPKAPAGDYKKFRLIFTTPTVFNNGWLPEWIDPKTLEGSYGDLKLRLITTALGKPIPIGGFDMKQRRSKPMYRGVPAGSVYYFEIVEGSFERAVQLFHGKAISDIARATEGFGLAFVGAVE